MRFARSQVLSIGVATGTHAAANAFKDNDPGPDASSEFGRSSLVSIRCFQFTGYDRYDTSTIGIVGIAGRCGDLID